MSLVFKKVKVEDFISIGSANLDFTPGVYLVDGVNKDLQSTETEEKISNGAGKTTMFSAIYQGLYNKNAKDSKATLPSVNNLYTKKPYHIVVEFKKGDDYYIIDNDRNINKITITKNGENVTPKGITNQLTYIKNIIGFDFQTFSSLTFLNQSSLENIIDLTNKDNIVYQFFDIEALNRLEKSIKKRKKDREEDRIAITSKLSVLRKQVKTFTIEDDGIDVDALEAQKQLLERSLLELEGKYASPQIKALESSVSIKTKELAEINGKLPFLSRDGKTLKEEYEKLKDGVCPTCGQAYKVDLKEIEGRLDNLREEYKKLKERADELSRSIEQSEGKLTELLQGLNWRKDELTRDIRNIQVKLLVKKEREEEKKALQKNIEEVEAEIEVLEKELPEIDNDVKVYDMLLAVFKSGAVVNEYLRKYQMLFVKNFKELQKHTTFAFDIKIKVNKGKMTYIFIDDGVEKPFALLSAGERTRVSLMLLLATLKTIEQLTNITINYLVLDELLGVLDSEGINFLKNVLSSMREDKSVFIITHHNEIEDSFADGKITVIKENNISRVEYE